MLQDETKVSKYRDDLLKQADHVDFIKWDSRYFSVSKYSETTKAAITQAKIECNRLFYHCVFSLKVGA